MATCPHCHRDAIGILAAHFSSTQRAPVKCPACGEVSWRDHQPSEPFGPVHAVTYVTTVLLMFGWLPLFLWEPSWWTASIPVFALVGGIVSRSWR